MHYFFSSKTLVQFYRNYTATHFIPYGLVTCTLSYISYDIYEYFRPVFFVVVSVAALFCLLILTLVLSCSDFKIQFNV